MARLEEAVRLGFAHPSILTHGGFEDFRDNPRYEALREEVQKRLDENR